MAIPKRLYNYFLLLFAITLFLRIVLTGYYNNNMGGIETNVVYGIQRILLGQQLYQDPSAGTYAVMQYTPLYYHVAAGVAKAVGVDGLNVQGIYMVCRILALICNLLTVLAAAAIIRIWGFRWQDALMAATPVLVVLTTHYFLRGDSLHLLFFVSTVYAYLLYGKQQRMDYLIAAGLLSAICIMAKQSGMLVCGIIGLSLVLQRRWGAAVAYTISAMICTAIIAWLYTDGTWLPMYQNAYLGLKNGTKFSFLYDIFISQFYYELIPCYVLGGVIAWLALRKVQDTQFRVLALGVVLSWLFAVVTGLKIGSSNNYFVEFLVLLIMALPYLLQSEAASQVLARPFGRAVSVRWFAGFAVVILLTSKTMGLFTSVYIDKSVKSNKAQYIADKELYRYFVNDLHIRQGAHILFIDRSFLDNIFIAYSIMPTKDVVSETYLANATTFDYSRFAAGLNNGLVNYVVTNQKNKDMNWWLTQLPFMRIDEHKFRWVGNKDGYSVYVFDEKSEI